MSLLLTPPLPPPVSAESLWIECAAAVAEILVRPCVGDRSGSQGAARLSELSGEIGLFASLAYAEFELFRFQRVLCFGSLAASRGISDF